MNEKDEFLGIKIYGFCDGYFGRYSYEDKTIVASGEKWIVVVNEDGNFNFADFDDCESMRNIISKWTKEDDNVLE